MYLFCQRYCPRVAIALQWWVSRNFHAMHCNSLVIQYNSWEDAKSEKKTNVFFLVKSSSHLFTFILNLFANSRKISNPAGRSGQVLISLDHQNSESCQLFLRWKKVTLLYLHLFKGGKVASWLLQLFLSSKQPRIPLILWPVHSCE